MAGICSWWDLPWCIGGDFNTTRFPCERVGDSLITRAMSEFDLISELQLVDLPMVGGDFTWSNGIAWSRLHRFLVSASWEALFPELSQKRMQRIVSDYFPIMLDCWSIFRGKSNFEFENMWLEDEGFIENLKG
ncbi:hypothetical protein CIPAW_12G101400 [Carya illinoinensis]|uniref:Endonuclease/exonuclease/phosphatase domain-containing protein n=1 Tax=Carya illinoinensis TaxID=32201 RepID=A0A8T1NX40_CARIL|nr:hypothetical protein CIPAW_12G101400 [Carya illinoinensis]